MEISNSLLVSLMFVTILTLGIANILMSLASIVSKQAGVSYYWIHSSWKVLLFLIYLSIFWHTANIVSIKDWDFTGFLFILCGPILIFFVTKVLLSDPKSSGDSDPVASYFNLAGRFFGIMALLQLWTIITDYFLSGGLTRKDGLNGTG